MVKTLKTITDYQQPLLSPDEKSGLKTKNALLMRKPLLSYIGRFILEKKGDQAKLPDGITFTLLQQKITSLSVTTLRSFISLNIDVWETYSAFFTNLLKEEPQQKTALPSTVNTLSGTAIRHEFANRIEISNDIYLDKSPQEFLENQEVQLMTNTGKIAATGRFFKHDTKRQVAEVWLEIVRLPNTSLTVSCGNHMVIGEFEPGSNVDWTDSLVRKEVSSSIPATSATPFVNNRPLHAAAHVTHTLTQPYENGVPLTNVQHEPKLATIEHAQNENEKSSAKHVIELQQELLQEKEKMLQAKDAEILELRNTLASQQTVILEANTKMLRLQQVKNNVSTAYKIMNDELPIAIDATYEFKGKFGRDRMSTVTISGKEMEDFKKLQRLEKAITWMGDKVNFEFDQYKSVKLVGKDIIDEFFRFYTQHTTIGKKDIKQFRDAFNRVLIKDKKQQTMTQMFPKSDN
jgi:hypothetical protein